LPFLTSSVISLGMQHNYLDPLYLQSAEKIKTLLEKKGVGDLTVAGIARDFSEPPQLEMGHLAFPCFQLAKTLKRKPNEIAIELAAEIAGLGFFSEAKAVGPYLNLFFSAQTLGELVVAPLLSEKLLTIPELKMNPVLVEYSQPNTHKELHVGHMRNLCLGNALVRMLKYSGRPVVANTFPGDVGTHVAKCLWYLKFHNQEQPVAGKEGEWLGRMYSVAHNKLEDEKGTPQEEINRQQLTEILKQLEQKSGEFYDLWKKTREWSIALMKKLYDWADVHFDVWFWESDVDSASVAWVKELYAQGKLQESKGAVGLDLEAEKLGFCLLLKSDGNGLYATKDLELARRKFEKYNPSQSVYVVDMRQELHFKQVFAALKHIGFEEQADRCFHLKYNFVELPDGAMSSRKGNIIPITDLINQMHEHVKTHYLSRYADEWSAEEVDATADMVTQGAIKYGMNSMDPNKKIVFKMEEWLKLDGESGPYIQYAHARICSLLEKNKVDISGPTSFSKLTEPSELQLLMKIAQFNKVVESGAQNLKTAQLCSYLYDLAKNFNSFYHDSPIGKLEDQELKQARSALAAATAKVLKQGLALLGIPAPAKM
jgi:arginyl-tRNA synthetase